MKSVSRETDGLSLADWPNDYVGANEAANGSITVIDLSLLRTGRQFPNGLVVKGRDVEFRWLTLGPKWAQTLSAPILSGLTIKL
jgi:hypothetical protein